MPSYCYLYLDLSLPSPLALELPSTPFTFAAPAPLLSSTLLFLHHPRLLLRLLLPVLLDLRHILELLLRLATRHLSLDLRWKECMQCEDNATNTKQ